MKKNRPVFNNFALIFMIVFFPYLYGEEACQEGNPILNELVYILRKPDTDRKVFRDTLRQAGRCMGIELAKMLETRKREVKTSLGKKAIHCVIDENPVLITILRGGEPFCLGFQDIFPNAKTGFLGTKRNEDTLEPKTFYVAIPKIKDKGVILIDTMIATGGSVIDAIKIVKRYEPKEIFVAGVISAKDGIERIRKLYPDVKILSAAIDPILNCNGYIVPGLGDAGDRAYGEKLE